MRNLVVALMAFLVAAFGAVVGYAGFTAPNSSSEEVVSLALAAVSVALAIALALTLPGAPARIQSLWRILEGPFVRHRFSPALRALDVVMLVLGMTAAIAGILGGGQHPFVLTCVGVAVTACSLGLWVFRHWADMPETAEEFFAGFRALFPKEEEQAPAEPILKPRRRA